LLSLGLDDAGTRFLESWEFFGLQQARNIAISIAVNGYDRSSEMNLWINRLPAEIKSCSHLRLLHVSFHIAQDVIAENVQEHFDLTTALVAKLEFRGNFTAALNSPPGRINLNAASFNAMLDIVDG
jgi:hypothetical protein